MKGLLYLEDGTQFWGNAFGKPGTALGELVFHTGMTGYQEVITDPSYAGQMICMTYPLIGNYGTNTSFSESVCAFLKGFLVKELTETPSNFTSQEDLASFLKNQEVLALSGIDTRKLTRIIRKSTGLKALITTETLSKSEMDQLLENYSMETDWVKKCSRQTTAHIPGDGKRIALLDLGVKKSIIRALVNRGCAVTIYPYSTNAETILSDNPDGVLLSNGPGDPLDIPEVTEEVRRIAEKKPIFGICLGHQLLALAFGAKTYRLPFGHHGGNHGVKDLKTGHCYITSQNHEFAVSKKSLVGTGFSPTLLNLNDGTVEGMRHDTLPIFSVQFHPEAAPGPLESSTLFDSFLSSLNEKEVG